MFLQRLAGLVLGFFIGILPVINTLAASFFAFSKKRKKTAISYLVAACVCIAAIAVSNYYDNQQKAADSMFVQTFQSNLQEVTVKSDVLIDPAEMESILKQVLTNTADQLSGKDERLEGLFANARTGKLSSRSAKGFHAFAEQVQKDYASKASMGTGKNRYNLAFGRSALEGQLGQGVRDFLKDYFYDEKSALHIVSLCFLTISFFIGWVGSTRQGWDLFYKPAAAITSPTNSTVDKSYGWRDDMYERFNRNTPPPLPQQNTAAPRNTASQETSTVPKSTVAGQINVNIAGEEGLMQLRGINRILAKTIIAERSTGGYFTGIADLQKRIDLSAEQVERMGGNLDFEPPKRGGAGGRVIEF